ncbi:hypothetical protein DERP_001113 [Dermatophagoides pteronyssinus]|uniref:Uncharacterized protein n=1 Tax=Dermatophagoides pteronyssinus TaxID=6956 RepID=A0ABQ8JDI7_DERPT|nr:hypothetical protein DERP_001113 [Dermatophagoides pteronyssinus]
MIIIFLFIFFEFIQLKTIFQNPNYKSEIEKKIYFHSGKACTIAFCHNAKKLHRLINVQKDKI